MTGAAGSDGGAAAEFSHLRSRLAPPGPLQPRTGYNYIYTLYNACII